MYTVYVWPHHIFWFSKLRHLDTYVLNKIIDTNVLFYCIVVLLYSIVAGLSRTVHVTEMSQDCPLYLSMSQDCPLYLSMSQR